MKQALTRPLSDDSINPTQSMLFSWQPLLPHRFGFESHVSVSSWLLPFQKRFFLQEIPTAVFGVAMPLEEGVLSAVNDLQTQRRIVIRFVGLPERCLQTRPGQPLSESTNLVAYTSSGFTCTSPFGLGVRGPVEEVLIGVLTATRVDLIYVMASIGS